MTVFYGASDRDTRDVPGRLAVWLIDAGLLAAAFAAGWAIGMMQEAVGW